MKIFTKDLKLNTKFKIQMMEQEILNQIPFEFFIGRKKFIIRLFSAWEHEVFSNLFLSWLINLSDIFGNEKIILDLDKPTINKELFQKNIKNIQFKYLIYELFKICCYPELFEYEYDIQYKTEIDKILEDNEIKKLIKKIKKKFQIDFKYFMIKLDDEQIMNLFFLLFVINIIGFKKKITRILTVMEKWTGIPLQDISECLTGYREPFKMKSKSLIMIDSEGHVVPYQNTKT